MPHGCNRYLNYKNSEEIKVKHPRAFVHCSAFLPRYQQHHGSVPLHGYDWFVKKYQKIMETDLLMHDFEVEWPWFYQRGTHINDLLNLM